MIYECYSSIIHLRAAPFLWKLVTRGFHIAPDRHPPQRTPCVNNISKTALNMAPAVFDLQPPRLPFPSFPYVISINRQRLSLLTSRSVDAGRVTASCCISLVVHLLRYTGDETISTRARSTRSRWPTYHTDVSMKNQSPLDVAACCHHRW